MTTFQFVSGALFLGLLVTAYRKELRSLLSWLPSPCVCPTPVDVKPSIAVTIVNDLVAITELRDKLAAEGCAEGVEACTNLLRVIVEQSQPARTTV